MKIIHVLNTGSYSGAENVVITIINKMKEDNEIIYVSKDGQIRKYLEENNIKFEPIEKLTLKEIRRVIKKYNPDVIHAHDFTASIICSFICKKRKLISHIHSNPLWLRKVNIKSITYLFSTIKYSEILMVSKSVIKEYIFKKMIYKKSKIVGNPIDIKSITKKAEEETDEAYDIAFIGRLSKAKKPLEFIKIVSQLKDKIKFKAVMIGDGELREECEKLIKEYKLSEVITMKGFIKNPYKILKNTKILCMTSEYEGYGLVAIESLALSKPVVATKVGGIPDIVTNECGIVTNNSKEMAEEIKLLLKDEEYYRQKSLKAFQRAQEINNIDIYIKELEEVYKKCIFT